MEMGIDIDDTWILCPSIYDSQDIFIKVPYPEEEGQSIYYIFEMSWYIEERTYYYEALRALGNDEFYFLQYNKKDLLALVYRTDQGELKGIALHQYDNVEGHIIQYFKIEQGNHVSQVSMYSAITGDQKHIGWNSSYWPEYPE